MSQSFDRRLGLMETAGLRIHLLICKSCQLAYTQLAFLHQLCKQIAAKPEDIVSLQSGLSAEAQERIVKELRRKQDEQSASGD